MGYLYVIVLFLSQSTYTKFDTPFTNIYVFTADEIKNLPVSSLDELLMLVPGMNKDYKTLHLWGSTGEGEIAYYLDGVLITKPEHINLNGIEEITIQKSGFSAEYGSGFAGIIYIKTKKPEKKSLNLSYLTDDHLPDEKINYGFNQYDINGQGMLINNLHYILSGKAFFTQVSSSGLHKVSSPGNGYNGLIGLTYIFNNQNNLSMRAYSFRDQSVYWHPNIIDGNPYKYFLQKPMVREKGKSIIFTGDLLLGRKTVSSVKYTITIIDSVYGNRDYEWENKNGHQWYNDYRLKAEHLIEYLNSEKISLKDILVDSLIQYHKESDMRSEKSLRNSPYGIRGIFFISGDYPAWCYYNSRIQRLYLKLIHNIASQNEIKCGMDFNWNEFDYYNNPLPWSVQSFWNYYKLTPGAISVYLEDKWITERLGIFAGIRYSYFDYGVSQPLLIPVLPGQDTLTRLKKNYISPRIGFVLPVTKRLSISFNGGEYYYEPGGYLAKFEPGKVRTFDMGIKSILVYDILFTGSLYQKYMYELYIQKVPYLYYGPWNYFYKYTYAYVDRAEVSGLEINFEKLFGKLFSMGLSYNLQFANQIPVYGYNYYYDYYYGSNDSIIGELINYERKYFPLDYDCRHSVKSLLILNFPQDFFTPFDNSTFSLFYSFYSGVPYTPEDLRGNSVGDMNSARTPARNNLDLRYLKKFKIGAVNLLFTALINNLFNTKQVVYVYPTTGKPNDHGDPEPSLGQFGWLSISSLFYSPQCDYNHDGLITPVEMRDEYLKARDDYYTNPLHYTNPFRIRLGLGFEFH